MGTRVWFVLSGVVLLIGGLLALILPLMATLAATLIVGWALILAGVMHIVQAVRTTEERWWNAGFGLVSLILGLSFVFNPLGGALSLTIFLGALFMALGLMQIYLGWTHRGEKGVWMLWVSGLLSVGLALMIAFNLFTAAVTVPGLLLAIELISTGIALMMLRPDQATTTAQVVGDAGSSGS